MPTSRVFTIAALTMPAAFTANTMENCPGLSPRTFCTTNGDAEMYEKSATNPNMNVNA